MNAKERVRLALRGRPADRVPLIPYISQFACVDAGVNYTRFCREPAVLAQTLVRCRNRYGYDGMYLSTDSAIEVEPMGCAVQYFDNDVPTVREHPWEGQELAACTMPRPDPSRDGRMPVYAAAIEAMRESTGDEYAIIAGSDGPLTILGHLRNVNQLMLDLVDEPEDTRRLLLEAAEVSLDFNLANLHAGATVCHLGDPIAALLGHKVYRELVWPAHKLIVERIHQAGGSVLGHFCGNTTVILNDLVDLGCDALNIDSQTGLDAAAKYSGRVCLMGDLDPVRLLGHGSRAELEHAIAKRMKLLKPTHHFILSSGCHLPADTPPTNVAAFVEFGLKYGQYPPSR